jgi:hypothetical protein
MAKTLATIYYSTTEKPVEPHVDRGLMGDLSGGQRRLALFQLAWAMARDASYRQGDKTSEAARLAKAVSYLREVVETFEAAPETAKAVQIPA